MMYTLEVKIQVDFENEKDALLGFDAARAELKKGVITLYKNNKVHKMIEVTSKIH